MTIYEYHGFSDKEYFAYWMGEILNCLFPKEYISNKITKKFLNEDERLAHYLRLVIDHSGCIDREDFDYEDNLARQNSDSDKCSGLIWDILRTIYPT